MKDGFIKRGKLTIRPKKDGGETLYSQLTIDDNEIIRAIENKSLAGQSPTKYLSDVFKRAFYGGVPL